MRILSDIAGTPVDEVFIGSCMTGFPHYMAAATILKGEFAYVPDKYFGLSNNVDNNNDGFLDSNGEVQKKHIRWGLGVDFNFWGTDFSPAIAQWIILDYEKGILKIVRRS